MVSFDDLRRLGLCLFLGSGLALGSSTPASAAKNCVMADEASARAAGDGAETEEDEDAPPKFSGAFYKRTFTLDVSLDGMDGRDLPISIESICGVPRPLASQALQLAGADGVAIVYSTTAVYNEDGSRERGQAASTAVGGADTATLKVRLARSWRENEDGDKVATFKTIRLDVTD